MIAAVTCPAGSVVPGGTKVCTGTYALTQPDVNAGKVDNKATATVTSAIGSTTTAPASTSRTFTASTSFTFDKQASALNDLDTNGPDVGDTITYSFVFTNTGTAALNTPSVTDDPVGAVSCPAAPVDPGASATCTKTYTLTQLDVESGAVNNTATGRMLRPDGSALPTSAPDATSTPINATGSMTLSTVPGAIVDLDANGPDVGDTIPFTFTVTNTGTSTINGLSITDPKIATSAIGCSPSTIAPNATSTCSATYVLTQPDIDAGRVDSSATANGTRAGEGPVSANRTATKIFVPTSSFTMDKRAAAIATGADGRPDAGDTITYSFVFTNSGATTLVDPAVSDPKTGPVACPAASLLPGQQITCATEYALTTPDIESGAVTNDATGTMSPPAGLPAPAASSDSTSTPVAPMPSAADDVSTGRQGQVQSVDALANDTPGDPSAPFDALTLTLLSGANGPTSRVVVEGGVYTVVNERLVFSPEAGFIGTATAARYRVTDAVGRSTSATYAPTVTPVTPVAVNDTSSGQINRSQSVDPLANDTAGEPSVPLDPSSLVLLDENGRPTSSVAVADGRYTMAAGRIVFMPKVGYVGTTVAARYQVADVNGTLATAAYTPTVADGAIVKDYAQTAKRGASVAFEPVAENPGLDGSTLGAHRTREPGEGGLAGRCLGSGQVDRRPEGRRDHVRPRGRFDRQPDTDQVCGTNERRHRRDRHAVHRLCGIRLAG